MAQQRSGGAPPPRAAELACFLASAASDGISGKLISAVWDPWPELPAHRADLRVRRLHAAADRPRRPRAGLGDRRPSVRSASSPAARVPASASRPPEAARRRRRRAVSLPSAAAAAIAWRAPRRHPRRPPRRPDRRRRRRRLRLRPRGDGPLRHAPASPAPPARCGARSTRLGDEFLVLYGDTYLRIDYRAVQDARRASAPRADDRAAQRGPLGGEQRRLR